MFTKKIIGIKIREHFNLNIDLQEEKDRGEMNEVVE